MINKLQARGVALLLAMTFWGATTHAFSTGITTASFGPSGCNQCHAGGTAPTTTLTGPTSVLQGSTNAYTLTVTNPGSQTHAGLNVSAPSGTMSLGGPDSAQTQVQSNQITHTSRKMNVAGVTTFTFNWTAPSAAFGSLTMNGWGNAVNFNFSSAGDLADLDSLVISDGGAPTPTQTPTRTETPTQTPTQTPTPSLTPVPPLCPPTPLTCTTPGKSSLTITNNADDTKDAVAFKWTKGPTTDTADFGTPTTTTSYALCIYQNGALHLEIDAPTSDTCGTKPCWAAKTKGFTYKDKLATPNGVKMLSLAVGSEAGKAKIQVKAKGLLIPDPGSIPMAVPVVAQVLNNGNAICWGDSWTIAEIDNDGVKFKAKSSD